MARNPVTRVTDHLIIIYELVLSNKRLIFPGMVGLIIALTIISQNSVLIESYSTEIFEETIFQDYSEDYGDIQIHGYVWDLRGLPSSTYNVFTSYPALDGMVESAIERTEYSDYVLEYRWHTSLQFDIWLNQSDPFAPQKQNRYYNRMFASSEPEFYTQIASILNNSGNGRLPTSTDELVLLQPKNFPYYDEEWHKVWENVTLGGEINITVGYGEYAMNKSTTIVGVVEYSPFETDSARGLFSKYLSSFYGEYRFLSTPNLLNETLSESVNAGVQDYDCSLEGELLLDHAQFNSYQLGEEMSKLTRFIQVLREELSRFFNNPNVDSDLLWRFQFFSGVILMLIVMLLLVSFPVIAIALYLVVYSFGLVRRQYQSQIGIIKTRGGSSFQVFSILVTEVIIATLIATGVGFAVGLVIADIIMRSSDFLQFTGDAVPVKATVPMIQNLIYWGIFFAFLLNLNRIIRMSRQNIIETQIPTEKRDPFWKRRYLDVSMFFLGTGVWVLFMSLQRQLLSGEEVAPLYFVIAPFLALLLIPAPFFIFFGTIMVIARSFPFLIRKLSNVLWRVGGGINAFSARNIVRHKQAANRAVLLVTLAISFSILSSSLIFSLDESARLRYYYDDGADVTLTDRTPINQTIVQILQNNVSHLTSISTTYSARNERSEFGYSVYNFLFVDPLTFTSAAAKMHASYRLSSSVSALMEELVDNQTVILYKGNVDALSTSIGENLTILFSNGSSSEQLSSQIGGTFQFWPGLYPQRYWGGSNYYWMVGSLGMFERLNASNYLNDITAKYLGNIDSEVNLEITVEQITNLTNMVPSAPALAYKAYKTSFGRIFSVSVLNSNLIICMAVSIVGVVMFAFFTYVERGKEIGVERALGMTRFQTAQSFLIEALVILAFGTLIGTITGMYFVEMFLQVMQMGYNVPPSVVSYPINLLIAMIGGILITAGIGTVGPAYLASKKDISRILKVE